MDIFEIKLATDFRNLLHKWMTKQSWVREMFSLDCLYNRYRRFRKHEYEYTNKMFVEKDRRLQTWKYFCDVMFWRYDVIQVSVLIFVVCQAFWILYTLPSRKTSYQQTCADDLVQNIEHQKENKTPEPMKKNKKITTCKWGESAMCSNNSRTSAYALIELIPVI